MQFIEDYNKDITYKLQLACVHHKLPLDMIAPKTKTGKIKPLGVWEFDGLYSRFKSLGAKRYLVEYALDNTLSTTVAGLGKKAGYRYLMKLCCTPQELEEYHRIDDEKDGDWYLLQVTKRRHKKLFELFNDSLYYPHGECGKNTLTYIDDEIQGTVIDYLGNVGEYHELSAVHMTEADFTLNLSVTYQQYLAGLKEVEIF